MGFNKRFANSKAMLHHYNNSGIQGVIDYFEKPDALLMPARQCCIAHAFELYQAQNLEQLDKFCRHHSQEYSKLSNQNMYYE